MLQWVLYLESFQHQKSCLNLSCCFGYLLCFVYFICCIPSILSLFTLYLFNDYFFLRLNLLNWIWNICQKNVLSHCTLCFSLPPYNFTLHFPFIYTGSIIYLSTLTFFSFPMSSSLIHIFWVNSVHGIIELVLFFFFPRNEQELNQNEHFIPQLSFSCPIPSLKFRFH